MPGARAAVGDRVTLRTVEREDRDFLQRGSANPEIRYPMGARLRSREEIEASLEDEADRFLVCLDDSDAGPGQPEGDTRPIGAVTVEDAGWKRPELTYWLVPEVHGEGYGKEAVSLAVGYAFRTYDTPVVSARAYAPNDASRGLLESLGFTQEGVLRGFMYVDGAHVDCAVYGLGREEWEKG
ncbi:GNAT family N-acetyltransferase [Saliphagus infecundisoli]|uniref:GNAT family N-acetyltransferase n=1 Tax=Saliphagus infecundisoli TaxID=1849069 RepID=A0ABD5QF85_9EURY|nr:GNAT family protein [Saliphagus infecundisoli]